MLPLYHLPSPYVVLQASYCTRLATCNKINVQILKSGKPLNTAAGTRKELPGPLQFLGKLGTLLVLLASSFCGVLQALLGSRQVAGRLCELGRLLGAPVV